MLHENVISIKSQATTAPAIPIPVGSFPDSPAGKSDRPPATIANVRHVLLHAGITVRYNEVSKRDEIVIPGRAGSRDNVDNVTLSHIVSLAAEHHMPTGNVPAFVEAIANDNAYNPMREWIGSAPWDRVDRMPQVYATVVTQADFPTSLKEVLLRKWLRSVVAAATRDSFHSRGVLTLQGRRGSASPRGSRRLSPTRCSPTP